MPFTLISSRIRGKGYLCEEVKVLKSLILYCSEYKKNTERIAQVFAKKANADLVNIKNLGDIHIEDYDLIGFGSGVYREDLSPKLYKLVDNLDIKNKSVFAFSTSGVGMKFYNKKLVNKLKSKGAIVKGSFACKGYFSAKEFTNVKIFDLLGKLSQGHPNNKDFKEAERFINKIIETIK